jgi:hypothetical protein
MLKIIDLNRDEELSASHMGKVAGGMDCDGAADVNTLLGIAGGILNGLGLKDAAWSLYNAGLSTVSHCTPSEVI